jgi:WNK lysine deficient protein kinase
MVHQQVPQQMVDQSGLYIQQPMQQSVSVTEQPTYLPQQPVIQQPVVQSLPQPLVVQSGIVQPVAQQIFVQTAYIQQQQQQPIHQIQHIEQQTYIQSAQVIEQYVPAAYQLPQNVEQQQQSAYVQSAPAELVRKQSGLCQQQLGAAATTTAGEKRLGRRLTNKRRQTAERGTRLSVLSVQGSVVECQVETMKQETVTFKFDQADTVPADVANNLIKHRLLSEQHAEIFIEQVMLIVKFDMNQSFNSISLRFQVEDILRQLRENPDVLPVVSLPPAKPAADSLSPNRSDTTATAAASTSSVGSVESVESTTKGSTADIPQSVPAAVLAVIPVAVPVAVLVVASAIPFPVGSHLHSRSTSLDGSDVCHTGPSDSAVSAVSAALTTIQSQTTTTSTVPPTNNLAPLSISNPGVAVTVDGATPPVESNEPVTPKVFNSLASPL